MGRTSTFLPASPKAGALLPASSTSHVFHVGTMRDNGNVTGGSGPSTSLPRDTAPSSRGARWCADPAARCPHRDHSATMTNWHFIKCQIKHQFRASCRPGAASSASYCNSQTGFLHASTPAPGLKNCRPGGQPSDGTLPWNSLPGGELLCLSQDPAHRSPLKRSALWPPTQSGRQFPRCMVAL